jgi:hypothetical protein
MDTVAVQNLRSGHCQTELESGPSVSYLLILVLLDILKLEKRHKLSFPSWSRNGLKGKEGRRFDGRIIPLLFYTLLFSRFSGCSSRGFFPLLYLVRNIDFEGVISK